jgi:hypothetical protein
MEMIEKFEEKIHIQKDVVHHITLFLELIYIVHLENDLLHNHKFLLYMDMYK